MTFLTPLFLIAALAGAIPVVLHMINRQKAKHLPFSTLRFLRISVQKTRRRKRIHDVLLMLLRVAVLLLIAFGLAEPTLSSLSSLWGGARSAVAIILDNSASMGTIDQDRVRFRTALSAAEQIMEQLQEGDQIALLVTSGPKIPETGKLDRTHEKVRQILGRWTDAPSPVTGVSYERADLAVKLQQAQNVLAKSDARNKQIYVLSDLQALSWEALDEGSRSHRERAGVRATHKEDGTSDPHPNPRPDGEGTEASEIPIIFVDCHRQANPNVAITGVKLQTPVPVAGVELKAIVELYNTSPVDQQPRLELYVNGSSEASSPALKIPAGDRLVHEFTFSFKTGGLQRGEVRLVGKDGSQMDDRRFFAIEVDQQIPLAIIKARRHEIPYLDDAFYIEKALTGRKSGGWAIRANTLVAGDLASEPLVNYTVIFCVNLPALDADTAERLRAYVAGGGNLVWICGDNVTADGYNPMNQQAGGQLLPAALLDVRTPGVGEDRDSWHLSFLDKKHPALSYLVEPASLYQSVLVYKHVRLDTEGTPDAQVLARLDDGEPLLVERAVEKGKVLLLGTSAHVGWTNLPLRKIFLPLVARLTFYLAGAERAQHQALAGMPLLLPLEDATQPVTVEVLPPSGETNRLRTKTEQGTSGRTFRYEDTHEVGIYLLRPLEGPQTRQVAYAVNLDPDETDPAKIDRESLQEHFGDTPLVFAEDPDDLSSTFSWLREGESLWELFLAGVLIVLVCETFLSNRLSPKQQEDQTALPPPGMRRLARKGRGGP